MVSLRTNLSTALVSLPERQSRVARYFPGTALCLACGCFHSAQAKRQIAGTVVRGKPDQEMDFDFCRPAHGNSAGLIFRPECGCVAVIGPNVFLSGVLLCNFRLGGD